MGLPSPLPTVMTLICTLRVSVDRKSNASDSCSKGPSSNTDQMLDKVTAIYRVLAVYFQAVRVSDLTRDHITVLFDAKI